MSLLQYLLFLLENDISIYIERNYLLGMDLSINPFIIETPQFNQYGLYNILIGFYEDTDYSYLNDSGICYSVLIILNTDISFLISKNTFYDEFRDSVRNNVKFGSCNFMININQDESLLNMNEDKLDLIKTDIFSGVFLPLLNDFEIYTGQSFLNLINNQMFNDIYLRSILKGSNLLKIEDKELVPRLHNCVLYMDNLNILYERSCIYITMLSKENKIVCKSLYLNKYSFINQNVNLFLQTLMRNIGESFFVENIYLTTVLPFTLIDIERLCEYLKVIQTKSSCNLYINEKYEESKINIFNYLQNNNIYFTKLSKVEVRGLYAKKV